MGNSSLEEAISSGISLGFFSLSSFVSPSITSHLSIDQIVPFNAIHQSLELRFLFRFFEIPSRVVSLTLNPSH